jgi:hypothetical protein
MTRWGRQKLRVTDAFASTHHVLVVFRRTGTLSGPAASRYPNPTLPLSLREPSSIKALRTNVLQILPSYDSIPLGFVVASGRTI